MYIRKSTEEDLPAKLQLYEEARQFMRENGNASQWGDHKPTLEQILRDERQGISYVCIDPDGQSGVKAPLDIVACFVYYVGVDPNYDEIRDGAWPNDTPYATVHRITTKTGSHGVGTFCLNWAHDQHAPLRMDTHRDNKPMQNLLRKVGFEYCGVISLIDDDGSDRDAFIWR